MLVRPSILIIIFLLSLKGLSQETNTIIEAEIKTQALGELIQVEATAKSKTEIIKSIKYILYTFREDLENKVTRTEKRELLVLQPNERKSLVLSSFSRNEKDKITLMLLIYDEDGKLLGRDRKVVLNDDEGQSAPVVLEPTKTEDDIYSGLLRGIITEDTKTKPGRDFFIEFSSLYRLQEINGIEVVKVFERFSFGRSTIMEVQVGNTVVHRFFTQPTRDYIKNQASQAIVNVSRYFVNLERNKNYIRQY